MSMNRKVWTSCPFSSTSSTSRSKHQKNLNPSKKRTPQLQLVRTASTENANTITERIFKSIEEKDNQNKSLGAGGATRLSDLRKIDAMWHKLKTKNTFGPRPEFVRRTNDQLPSTPHLDVVIAGGTLGIFLGAALQHAGLNVAIIERGKLQGRSQDWNISREELHQLVKLGVLTQDDLDDCISIEFNPIRAGFHGYDALWTADVLNVGANPQKLVTAAAKRFTEEGGLVVDEMMLKECWIHPNGIQIRMTKNSPSVPPPGKDDVTNTENVQAVHPDYAIASKLLVDCMGNQSPIVRQVRHGQKPDGVCLVVGACARGFDPEKNTTGDLIYTNGPSEPPSGRSGVKESTKLRDLQLFWEAFPAGSGPTDRTTYMFTYLDASPQRPSLEDLLEHYWHAMPEYQGIDVNTLEILRVLFGVFPTYKDSPLQTPYFDRIVAVGDASGMQSPLSFGGFAALTRHMRRLTGAIVDAVHADALDAWHLRFINPYNPSLSSAWMMQKAMSCRAGSREYDVNFINRLLGGNFKAMGEMGDRVLKPFLQDVIQVDPLMETLLGQMKSDPFFVPQIIMRVGPAALAEWMVHFVAMAAYTLAYTVAERLGVDKRGEMHQRGKLTKGQYISRRAIERWQYGSGMDYVCTTAGDSTITTTAEKNGGSTGE